MRLDKIKIVNKDYLAKLEEITKEQKELLEVWLKTVEVSMSIGEIITLRNLTKDTLEEGVSNDNTNT